MPLNMRNYTIHCKFISWFCRWYREKMRELRVRSQKAPKTRVTIFQVTSISGWPGPWEPTALQSPQASAPHRRIRRCWTHRRRRGPSDDSWALHSAPWVEMGMGGPLKKHFRETLFGKFGNHRFWGRPKIVEIGLQMGWKMNLRNQDVQFFFWKVCGKKCLILKLRIKWLWRWQFSFQDLVGDFAEEYS